MIDSGDRQPPRTLYLVKRAETVVRAGLEACLQPLDLTPRQYITLSLLRDDRDQSSADLARKAGITPQSMSETIASLAAKRLIVRQENPDHRRILMTRLTEAGSVLLAACEIEVDAMEARLFSTLSAGDLANLRQGLRTIIKCSEPLSA